LTENPVAATIEWKNSPRGMIGTKGSLRILKQWSLEKQIRKITNDTGTDVGGGALFERKKVLCSQDH